MRVVTVDSYNGLIFCCLYPKGIDYNIGQTIRSYRICIHYSIFTLFFLLHLNQVRVFSKFLHFYRALFNPCRTRTIRMVSFTHFNNSISAFFLIFKDGNNLERVCIVINTTYNELH